MCIRDRLCGLDGGQSEVYGDHAGSHPLGAATRPAGGTATVGRWKPEHLSLIHISEAAASHIPTALLNSNPVPAL